ncbi:MAG: phosphoribosylformylglycinamidine cyclo-ligase [Holophagales bacterium]|jgi:phosphoribosylformylglycinamidine cyclo-ligase|nr:phosphoribosylformylglycinamidine cyclo-ligase [Holophagales bacterium]
MELLYIYTQPIQVNVAWYKWKGLVNMVKHSVTYASSGVDISRQDDALARIKPLVKATKTSGVRSDIGLFGGLFNARFTESKPLLVASMDGVGTKMKVARMAGIWNTVGADLVNHCINDILVQGARPLFFLDYIAAQKLEPDVIEKIVQGMADACKAADCALIGGELAEMPGVYAEGEIDVAGSITGITDEENLLPRSKDMMPGDVVIALPSSGLHTNGYSLARKVCFEIAGLGVNDELPGTGQSVAQALLAVHKSYLPHLLPLVENKKLLAMAHITGGGLTDNVPRILPPNLDFVADTSSWEIPPLFRFIIEKANMPIEDARHSFNLGAGMAVIVKKENCDFVINHLKTTGETPWIIGELAGGAGCVVYK